MLVALRGKLNCAAGIDVAGDAYLSLVSRRYAQLRKFTPLLLSTFKFRAADDTDLLDAVDTLHSLNDTGTRLLPADAPIGFASNLGRFSVTPCSEGKCVGPGHGSY